MAVPHDPKQIAFTSCTAYEFKDDLALNESNEYKFIPMRPLALPAQTGDRASLAENLLAPPTHEDCTSNDGGTAMPTPSQNMSTASRKSHDDDEHYYEPTAVALSDTTTPPTATVPAIATPMLKSCDPASRTKTYENTLATATCEDRVLNGGSTAGVPATSQKSTDAEEHCEPITATLSNTTTLPTAAVPGATATPANVTPTNTTPTVAMPTIVAASTITTQDVEYHKMGHSSTADAIQDTKV